MLANYALAMLTAVLVALAVDHRLGEPPARWHPVVWMGNYLERAGAWLQTLAKPDPQARDIKVFAAGAAAWLAGAYAVLAIAALLEWVLLALPWWASGVLLGLLLKPLLAWAMLKSEVCAVEAALAQGLEQGRGRLRWLVSRDVTTLTDTQVRESAIETLAENFNDSVVAPLFWFALLGLPGAAIYRFANTADAMWGYPGVYKGRNWAWAGKWAARVDDVLNWIPARITAFALLLAVGMRGLRAVRQLPQEARRTPSPNSGWPMAAMALVLDVALQKPGVYVLHVQGRQAQATHMPQAIRIANKALVCLMAVLCGAAAVGAAWLGVVSALTDIGASGAGRLAP
jgi:adenosylcobinamide-phosphate synthase